MVGTVLIANIIALILFLIVHHIAKTKTKAIKMIIWGSLMMFPFSFIVSFIIGLNYNLLDGGSPPMGFEVAFYLIPVVGAIGLMIFGKGIVEVLEDRISENKKEEQ